MRTKISIYAILLFIFAIFIIQNVEIVTVTFLFWDLAVPRAILLISTFALGAAFWALLPVKKIFTSKD